MNPSVPPPPTSSTTPIQLSETAKQRLVYGKDDALFGYIEKQQTGVIMASSSIPSTSSTTTSSSSIPSSSCFGHVLDAGTGLHSLRWIASLFHTNNSTSTSTTGSNTTPAQEQPPPPQQPPRIISYTAITADLQMQSNCIKECHELGISQFGSVLHGQWFTTTPSSSNSTFSSSSSSIMEQLTAMQQRRPQHHPPYYDVILVDYLIGAMDGFTPYQQDLIIPLLVSLLHPNHGRLYIVGLQPIPDQVITTPPLTTGNTNNTATSTSTATTTAAMNLICRVRQVRDACILLAGQRCYREYPIEWIVRQIQLQQQQQQSNNHTISNISISNNNNDNHHHHSTVRMVHSKQFPILYRHTSIVKQINVGRSKLPYMSILVQDAMKLLLNDLEQESQQYFSSSNNHNNNNNNNNTTRIQFGFDYVVCIEKRITDNNNSNVKE